MDLDKMISKSLDEIDTMVEQFSKSKADEVEEDKISKAQNDEDLSAGDVSEDAPEQQDDEPVQDEPEQQDDVESSNEDVDQDAEGEEDVDEDGDVEKSLEGDLKANESVRKALEVSEFLNELVKSISEHISTHNENLSKSIESTSKSNELLAKSLLGITKSQRAVLENQQQLMKSIDTLNSRLEAIEKQPMVRKSVPSKNVQQINKSFDASLGGKPSNNQLSKSEISAKLTKSFEEGNHQLLDDVLAFDATGDISTLSTEAKKILGLS